MLSTNRDLCLSSCSAQTDYLCPETQCACRWFVKSAAVLEAAYEEVEAGRLIDHPKQATLQKVLTGIVTMQPVRLPLITSDLSHVYPSVVTDMQVQAVKLDQYQYCDV